MGYEITLESIRPPESGADFGGGDTSTLDLTDEQEADWRRIVSAVRRRIGSAVAYRYPTHRELWLERPAIQLWYAADVASVEVSYQHSTTPAAARLALATAYALAELVSLETGLTGFDHEVGQPVPGGDLERAVARFRGVGDRVRRLSGERRRQSDPTRRTNDWSTGSAGEGGLRDQDVHRGQEA